MRPEPICQPVQNKRQIHRLIGQFLHVNIRPRGHGRLAGIGKEIDRRMGAADDEAAHPFQELCIGIDGVEQLLDRRRARAAFQPRAVERDHQAAIGGLGDLRAEA